MIERLREWVEERGIPPGLGMTNEGRNDGLG